MKHSMLFHLGLNPTKGGHTPQSGDLEANYYDFARYVTKQRMLTYWYQINEVLSLKPHSVLEVGVGTGIVCNYLRSVGIDVRTADVNPRLKPDYVVSIVDLASVVPEKTYDVVLCARVLHHVDFDRVRSGLEQIATVSRRFAVLTLPVEDFSVYAGFRYTSSSFRTLRLPLPLMVKRNMFWRGTRSGLWKVNDTRGRSLAVVRAAMEDKFEILRDYRMSEDAAHYLAVLSKIEP